MTGGAHDQRRIFPLPIVKSDEAARKADRAHAERRPDGNQAGLSLCRRLNEQGTEPFVLGHLYSRGGTSRCPSALRNARTVGVAHQAILHRLLDLSWRSILAFAVV
jgi:hypothetical protein